MAKNNHIPPFTAADIASYHRGLLSASERHALEKAALDDPFLADALEGYATSGVQLEADVADLRKRLANRTEHSKVIPLAGGNRSGFRMLRAAAMIVFIAGAGLLIYQFGFNRKTENLAKAETSTDSEKKSGAGDSSTAAPVKTDPEISTPENTATTGTVSVPAREHTTAPIAVPPPPDQAVAGNNQVKDDIAPAVTPATPSQTPSVNNESAVVSGKTADNRELATNDEQKKTARAEARQVEKKLTQNQPDQDQHRNNRAVSASRKTEELHFQNQSANIFRGGVTDAEDNGVPFANVTNARDNNAGTYTDAKGYFNITSPDTVLEVQVRSIGFENSQAQLRNTVPYNQVVLQNNRSSLSEIVVTSQKPNAAARSGNQSVKPEEPEPADGWDKYDSYLANNLRAPEDFKPGQAAVPNTVEVSFEVNKAGEPVNLKIERSLCATCDKEAIRLIKEGPKWKQKAKKSRTRVTINF